MSRNNEKVESGAIYVIRSAEGPRYTGGARPSEADVRKDVGELLRAAGVRTVQPAPVDGEFCALRPHTIGPHMGPSDLGRGEPLPHRHGNPCDSACECEGIGAITSPLGYLVIPDSAFPAVGIDSEYVTEVATLMAQLGISKDDIAAHLQTVARFRNLVPQLDMSDAQWEAMIRWFREFMRTFGGFNNGTKG